MARVGSEQMNAALGGGVAMQMLTFFFIGLTGYSTALVAQYFGAGEKQNTTKSAFQAVLIALLAGLSLCFRNQFYRCTSRWPEYRHHN